MKKKRDRQTTKRERKREKNYTKFSTNSKPQCFEQVQKNLKQRKKKNNVICFGMYLRVSFGDNYPLDERVIKVNEAHLINSTNNFSFFSYSKK